MISLSGMDTPIGFDCVTKPPTTCITIHPRPPSKSIISDLCSDDSENKAKPNYPYLKSSVIHPNL